MHFQLEENKNEEQNGQSWRREIFFPRRKRMAEKKKEEHIWPRKIFGQKERIRKLFAGLPVKKVYPFFFTSRGVAQYLVTAGPNDNS